MSCQLCENLERAFKARWNEYCEANTASYSLVSNKFAAYLNVEMERARNELEEHRLTCVFATNAPASLSAMAQRQCTPEKVRRSGRVETAA